MMLGMNSFAVSKASSEPLPELAEFLKPFAPLFRRRQSRQSLERYITGLLTDLGRKNCQTIASAVAGTSTERLQHLLTDAEWDPLELDAARVRSLSKRSPKGGILILDDTSLPKKGNSSVGVAPQYCGTLGKIANCQIVVSARTTWWMSHLAVLHYTGPFLGGCTCRRRAGLKTLSAESGSTFLKR